METETKQAQPYRNPFAEPGWSHAEKAVARKAFESALDMELQDTVSSARHRMEQVHEASDLWDLETWLGKRRREINEKYDYRYSVLLTVFARLIYEGRLSEDDLKGLRADKIDEIRRYLSYARRD